MEKRFEAVLKLEELRKRKQQNKDLLNEINRLKSTVGLSDSTYNEIVEKIDGELDNIINQIFEIKENL